MKNIFFVSIDALRADHLGCMGYKKNITPNIDQLAREGILFTRAISPGSYTFLSFPSILSSLYPSEYFICQKSSRTIVDFLKEYGFKTASFNSNPHAKGSLDRDFDFFDDLLRYSEFDKPLEKIKRRVEKKIGQKFIAKKLRELLVHFSSDIAKPYADAKNMNEKAFEWLKKNINRPVFFWIHYMDPHYPYYPPKEFTDLSNKEVARLNRLFWMNFLMKNKSDKKDLLTKEDISRIIELYDGEIAYVDNHLGKFFKKLKEMSLYDKSLIFLFSDHGDMFGEHGKFSHDEYSLYNGQLQVPLIIKGLKHEGKIVNRHVTTMDIVPTLIDSVGLKSTTFNDKHLIKMKRDFIISEGFKIQDVLSDSGLNAHKINFSCYWKNWKFIENSVEDKIELYNLTNDVNEDFNLIEEEKEIASKLLNIIRQHKIRIFKMQEIRKNIQKVIRNVRI